MKFELKGGKYVNFKGPASLYSSPKSMSINWNVAMRGYSNGESS